VYRIKKLGKRPRFKKRTGETIIIIIIIIIIKAKVKNKAIPVTGLGGL
jgi:hypothetical protein